VTAGKALFVNSALAFASAQLIGAALHETGHGIAAQLLGFHPRIYAFFEDNPTGDARQTLTILAAGPLASLLLGILFWLWYRASKPRYSFPRLLLLWLAVGGVMTFVNYLIVTPWLAGGDTAQFADVLGWPTIARYGISAVGVAIMISLARPAARALFDVAPRAVDLGSTRARRRFILRAFYLPLIAGAFLTTVGAIGGPPLILIYEFLAAFGTIDIVGAAMYAGVTPPRGDDRAPDAPLRIEPAAILLYVVLVLVYVFAFSRGVPI